MAKKQPATPKPNPSATTAPTPQPSKNYLERPDTATESDGTLQKIFYGLAGFALLVMVALSLKSGINADDKFQNDYSLKLMEYYSTMGKDTTALYIKDGNMHLYGGFFEVVTGAMNKAAGLQPNNAAYHDVRHASSAFFGWLAMVFAALLARYIAGWRAGLATFVIMFLSPRFFGDSLMNPKDIPFAAGYIMALYYTVRVLDAMPRPNRWHLVGLAGGLAIALATRAGGLLPFATFGLFAGLHFLLRNGGFSALGNMGLMGKYIVYGGIALVAGYVLAILFWPYALKSPLSNPLNALSQFEALVIRIRVLFEGLNVRSDKVPWYYAAKWIYLTIPLASIVGVAGSILLSGRLMRRYNPLWILLVLFAGIFPVFYVIYKDSVLHDGWRHLTFAYPPLAVAAGLFWNELSRFFPDKKTIQYAAFGAMGLLLSDSALFIARNSAFPYIYFNPIAGGVKGAFGQYETDYWGVSVRQGMEWLEAQNIINDTMTTPVVIATNMFYPAAKYAAKYGDKVRVKYLKYDARCNDAWDYALYPTRTIGGPTLQKGTWPPDNAVHIIEADGAPILAILKDNGRNCVLGHAALKVNDLDGAIDKLKAELEKVPDNELAWGSLSQAYLSYAQAAAQQVPAAADSLLTLAKQSAEKGLEVSPDDSQCNNLIGMYWIEKNDLAKAKSQFEYSAKMEPSNPGAYYYLALIATEQNNAGLALDYAQKAIEANPSFKPAYELAIRIYEQQGNSAQANRLRAFLKQMK
jgi:tetratricopeptide (TPR) repeat protein